MIIEAHEGYAFHAFVYSKIYTKKDNNSRHSEQIGIVNSDTSSHTSLNAICLTNVGPYLTKANLAQAEVPYM